MIRDAQTGSALTFQAMPELMSGVKPGDRIRIKFTQKGEVLVADEITSLR